MSSRNIPSHFSPSAFSRKLMAWYRTHARDLPWRRTNDPYKIWISEVMLQQTTVNAVIPYYLRWMKRYPDIRAVVKAPLQDILKSWQGLGYYRRARHIREAATVIQEKHGGRIPTDAKILKTLPGFGPYTVGAVLSIAYNQPVAIIDANIRRVVMRLSAMRGEADRAYDKKIMCFLDNVMPLRQANIFNQAMMELGALVCRNRQPACLMCPVRNVCLAYRRGIQEIIPKTKARVIKNINAVVAILKKSGRYYIQRRPSKGLLADLWEFPGGKLQEGESAQKALRRELQEELRIQIQSMRHFMTIQHAYTQFRVNLSSWICHVQPLPQTDLTHKWVAKKNLAKYPMPSGSARIVEKLMVSS